MNIFNSKIVVVGRMSNHSRSEDDASESPNEEKGDESIISSSKIRRKMTAKEVDIGDLFNTNMFRNKKIFEMEKILHTMK